MDRDNLSSAAILARKLTVLIEDGERRVYRGEAEATTRGATIAVRSARAQAAGVACILHKPLVSRDIAESLDRMLSART